MKEKIKKIFLGVIIGVFALPTITLGGSFTVSLIQGKSVEEAVQILAEQIDSLIGRVEVLEVKQSELEAQQLKSELWRRKEEACRSADELNYSIYESLKRSESPRFSSTVSCSALIEDYPTTNLKNLWGITDTIEGLYNWIRSCPEHPDLNLIKSAHDEYLQAKQECYDLTAQYSSEEFNEMMCHNVTKTEGQIQEIQNWIQELTQNYIAKKDLCEPFTFRISSECLNFKDSDQDLDCCYKYAPPKEYPEGFPVKDCCMFFYRGEENYNETLASYNNRIEQFQSNPEYLYAKERCME